MNRHSAVVPVTITDAPAAMAAAAKRWGAEWRDDEGSGGGQLVLPVIFGLRRGVLVGRVEIETSDDGIRLTWQLAESHLELQRWAVALLVLALALLLPGLAWPFYPPLLALLPLAAVTGLMAWWLVLSRLQTSGPEEFFSTVGPHDEKASS